MKSFYSFASLAVVAVSQEVEDIGPWGYSYSNTDTPITETQLLTYDADEMPVAWKLTTYTALEYDTGN